MTAFASVLLRISAVLPSPSGTICHRDYRFQHCNSSHDWTCCRVQTLQGVRGLKVIYLCAMMDGYLSKSNQFYLRGLKAKVLLYWCLLSFILLGVGPWPLIKIVVTGSNPGFEPSSYIYISTVRFSSQFKIPEADQKRLMREKRPRIILVLSLTLYSSCDWNTSRCNQRPAECGSAKLLNVDQKGIRTPPPQFWSNDCWSIDVLPSELTARLAQMVEHQYFNYRSIRQVAEELSVFQFCWLIYVE